MKTGLNKTAYFTTAIMLTSFLAGCSVPMYPTVQTGTQPAVLSVDEVKAPCDSSAAELVADIPTVQAFSENTVSDEDVLAILMAGINSPSAMNSQPWHFSVVSDPELLQRISDDMSMGMPAGGMPPAGAPDGDGKEAPKPPAPGGNGPKAGIADAPLAIIISCVEGKEFDAGLACQLMSVEAQLLGYGTKIISSPTIALNGDNKAEYSELLGIPKDQSAAAVLLIGEEEKGTDAVSSATERNPMEETVTFFGEDNDNKEAVTLSEEAEEKDLSAQDTDFAPAEEEQDTADTDSVTDSAVPGPVVGGWKTILHEAEPLPEDAQAAFDKAVEKLVGAKYTPVSLLSTQLVAGTNYCILCQVSPVVSDPEPNWALVYIYADLQGNAEIMNVYDLYVDRHSMP